MSDQSDSSGPTHPGGAESSHPSSRPSSEGDLIRKARAEAAALPRSASPPEQEDVFAPLPPSGTFAGYEVIRVLSRGGQGIVYVAVQQSTRRQVAIKVPREGSFTRFDDLARFEREMETLARLDHPNIVTILDRGTAGGRHWFAMDYIAGPTLDVWVAESQRTREDVLAVFAKICRAIHAAHMQGVIHRDLKPANIRVDASGEPHILDFGLAKSVDPAEDVLEMTQAGDFVGTPVWASPEQLARDPGKVDTRTDIYSLGLILYKLLTGRSPFAMARHRMELLEALRRAGPEPASSVSKDVDDELSTIVDKCLKAERGERYQSVSELARDIAHYLANEPIEAKRDSRFYLLRKTLSRHRRIAAIAAIAVAMVATSAVVAVVQRNAARAAAVVAQRALEERNDTTDFLIVDLFESVDPQIRDRANLPISHFLASATSAAEVRFGGAPLKKAAILRVIGRGQLAIGDLAAAVDTLEKSIAAYRKVGDEQGLAESLAVYGRILIERRGALNLTRAWNALEEAKAIEVRRSGPVSAELAHVIGELASVAYWQNRLEESLTLELEAFAMISRVAARSDERLYRARHQLGLRRVHVGRRRGDTELQDQGIEDLRRALADATHVHGADSVQVAVVQAVLGSTLYWRSRETAFEGREWLQRSIALEVRLRSAHDYRVAHRRVMLAQSFLTQAQEFDAAEAELRQAIDSFARSLASGDERVQNAVSLLGRTLLEQGRDDEAIDVLRDAIELMDRHVLVERHEVPTWQPANRWQADRIETRIWLGMALRRQEVPRVIRSLVGLAPPMRTEPADSAARYLLPELSRLEALLNPNDPAIARLRARIDALPAFEVGPARR